MSSEAWGNDLSLNLSCRLYSENPGLQVALPVKWSIVHQPQRTPFCLSPAQHTTAQRRVLAARTAVPRAGENLKYPPCLSGCRVVSAAGSEEAAPTPDWVPARTPASAPAHLATGSPGVPSSPRASAPFAVPFSAAPLPAHFFCLPGPRALSRAPLGVRAVVPRSLTRRLSGGPRRRDERRLLELRERGAGGGARLQLSAARGRSGCCLLLWLPRPQVLLRRPAQLLPLRAQLHVVAQVQALALTSP